MSTNFNDTTPAAPAGGQNVKWQTDGSGNDSAYVPSGTFSPIGGQATPVNLLTQAANIVATDLIPAGSVVAGLYRVSIYIIVTQAASSSSTLPSVSITWTDADNNTAQTILATATNAGNILTTYMQATVVIDAKAAAAIQYTTAGYASSGGTPMQYALHVRAEQL